MTKREAATELAILAAEIRLALDGSDEDCPDWPETLDRIAWALDPTPWERRG